MIFTAWDQTLSGDGHVALWTENDNVTRFDSIAIGPIPLSARRLADDLADEATLLRSARIKGMSERLIVSHYENNYGGAVKRLNLIEEQLAELDYASAPGFLINGLKREQLIAMNSMILHELFFDGLGEQSEPGPALAMHWRATSALMSAGAPNSSRWARRSAAARAGCC